MVPPSSLGISRVPRYSGSRPAASVFAYKTLTSFGTASHPFRLTSSVLPSVPTPCVFLLTVWPLSLSLATTHEISFDFSSSAYLDVSVRRVPFRTLWIHVRIRASSARGFPHSEICGSFAYFQLTAAFRRLSRPSSAPGAKASILCSFSLEQLRSCSLHKLASCLSFANNCWVVSTFVTTVFRFRRIFRSVGSIVVSHFRKDLLSLKNLSLTTICSFLFFALFGFQ